MIWFSIISTNKYLKSEVCIFYSHSMSQYFAGPAFIVIMDPAASLFACESDNQTEN